MLNNGVGSSTGNSSGLIDPTEHVSPVANNHSGIVSGEVPPEDLDSRWLRWKCLVCGYLYEGVTPLSVCPKCGNDDPDKFEDAE